MPSIASLSKRLFIGRPVRSDRLGETLLPKRIALPVFASDALSSVAYAPEEIFRTLSVAGLSAYAFSPAVGLVVAVVMLTVVASYRQNVRAYTSGGGDYEVATTNLGGNAGLTVGSALLVDYVLTVAVSVSSGVANLGAAVPFIGRHGPTSAVVLIVALAAMNLRGVRESGTAFAIPTYCFILAIFAMLGYGFLRIAGGTQLHVASAGLHLKAEHSFAGFALIFLLLRSFSSGCAALTGVEAISNGVPAFRTPKGTNAATTLLMMGLISVSMFMGLIFLAKATGLKVADSPSRQLPGAHGTALDTAIAQLARTVFSNFSIGFYFVTISTSVILILAANTAFNGFPVLGSILAQDRFLPRQLHTRGDRLAYSNGIVFLALFASTLVFAFDASVNRLIQLYIVGVFVSFTMSQTGMVRHWTKLLRTERDQAARRRMMRSRAINAFGAAMTGAVLVVVLTTKFVKGAWIAVAMMVVIFVTMRAIRRHYDRISRELAPPDDDQPMLPARNHAVVLVSKVHQPTLRAVAYARATRPDTLTAVTVNVDDADTRALQQEWERREIAVPLTVVESPFREITRPILDYIKRIRRDSPRDVVTVFIPEYVVGHWWEQLLHNQSALRLKSKLLFEPGVMVTNVAWQLKSSAQRASRTDRTPVDVRRGITDEPGREDQAAGDP
ncbi:MAG: APC family permease [Actinomycetota bacterium]|nr:APC family permease [Actinomycetota bacterium]